MRRMNLLTLMLIFAVQSAFAQYDREQAMTVAKINGIDIAYTVAQPKNEGMTNPAVETPTVLLIMGLTGSHRLWDQALVNGLVDGGYTVVLFDNRDTGQSARLDELGNPTLWWQMLKSVVGLDVDAPYSLRDMANDAVGVLDELDIEKAHVVGASMGGMIAQIVAAEHTDRVLSLTSIMSTTGAPHLPEATGDAQGDLLDLGDSEGEEATARLHDFGIHPEALPRQLMAIISAGDRSEQVKTISVPTLVQHGADDPLLPPPHGEHTASLIEGSRYVVYEGMAHDTPEAVVPLLVNDMVEHFGQSDVNRVSQSGAD